MKIIKKYVGVFEQFARDQLQDRKPEGLYEPIHYGMDSSGKRIRPVLCLMGHQLYDDNIQEAMPAAYAVELFHNFTLFHDDIMDKADVRRGQPSIYIKYGVPSAILSGDAMMMLANQYLLMYNDSVLVKSLMEVFTENAIGVCEGQQSDMDFENRNDVSIEEYLEMIANKTSILLGASIQMGALVAGAPTEDLHHLHQFGRYVGIAFQIHDDVLDVFGDTDKVGKIEAGDIVNNKKTYLYIKALQLASPEVKSELGDLYGIVNETDNIEKIRKVKEIFQSLAVKEYAEQLKEAYLDLGISHLMATSGKEEVKEQLIELAKYLIARDY